MQAGLGTRNITHGRNIITMCYQTEKWCRRVDIFEMEASWSPMYYADVRDKGTGVAHGYVGVLGTRVPRLAYLRPSAWLHQWPGMTHIPQQPLKSLMRAQAS